MTQRILRLMLLGGCMFLLLVLSLPAESRASSASAVRAEATDIKLSGVITFDLNKVGPIPSTGGTQQNVLLDVTVGDILSAGRLGATASGNRSQGKALSRTDIVDLEASLALGVLGIGTVGVSDDTIDSNADAKCVNGVAVCTGRVKIEELSITGIGSPINADVNTPPNTQLIPVISGIQVGTLTINKQTITQPNSKTCDITVQAVNLTLNPLGLPSQSVILGESKAGITCK